MGLSLRSKRVFSSFRTLIKQQRFTHTLTEDKLQAQRYPEVGSDFVARQGKMDMSKWKELDSRTLGVERSRIPHSPWTVLKILHKNGFAAYLVGGCVRDLLLNKVPKDFDVITNANLMQIRKQFHRARIVGRRFPICMVHVGTSVIDVSSFETVAQHANKKEELDFSQMPRGCSKKNFTLWRNSMHRDFTINSLFFDPFLNKIYDYANGMADLRSLKLRTLIPAQISFKEDCARILRGIRLAARLGLSFSKDTETAIRRLSSSIMRLDKARLMMELNYMLSFGAAEPSLCLLRRFNLLKSLLPFHAAYLDDQKDNMKCDQSSVMLMKLLFNLDKLVSCDRPSDCRLWIGLLAFHIALVKNPQDALVVVAFASILYHGEWRKGIKFARENAEVRVNFIPEISRSFVSKSDEALAQEISQFASRVQDSLDVFQYSDLVLVSKMTEQDVAEIFQVLVNDIESYKNGRKNFEIDHRVLGQGNLYETRFVMGKVILETMSCGTLQGGKKDVEENNHVRQINIDGNESNDNMEHCDVLKKQAVIQKGGKRFGCTSYEKQGLVKKLKLIEKTYGPSEQKVVLGKEEVVEREECEDMAKRNVPHEELISVLGNMLDETRCQIPKEKKEKIENKNGTAEKKSRLKPLKLPNKGAKVKCEQKSDIVEASRPLKQLPNKGAKVKCEQKSDIVEASRPLKLPNKGAKVKCEQKSDIVEASRPLKQLPNKGGKVKCEQKSDIVEASRPLKLPNKGAKVKCEQKSGIVEASRPLKLPNKGAKVTCEQKSDIVEASRPLKLPNKGAKVKCEQKSDIVEASRPLKLPNKGAKVNCEQKSDIVEASRPLKLPNKGAKVKCEQKSDIVEASRPLKQLPNKGAKVKCKQKSDIVEASRRPLSSIFK